MRWFITDTFKFVDNPKWIFDDFDITLETAHKLSQTMGNLYIWKETKGQPIKWMKVTKWIQWKLILKAEY